MPHTKEPWRASLTAGDAVVADDSGGHALDAETIAFYGGDLVAESISAENRRRIVACVNACRGMSNETLEAIGSHGERDGRPIVRLLVAMSVYTDKESDLLKMSKAGG